ncbi:MAG: hypothetical protein KGR98_12620, partial [Verrucomicrobia bacterium]|nr:hypothetical protein [Verrucomicrobiota bacterium]
VTNAYTFVNAQIYPTTVATNALSDEESNYLAAMPGNIQVSGTSNLDLSYAQISGANYLSMQSPNQFDGNQGASIAAPFLNINLGVTNGNLTVSNLAAPLVPDWQGTLQAWNARWLQLATNIVITTSNAPPPATNITYVTNSFTITNDFRVVIVENQATPTSPSEVWDLFLHGTNSIVISDSFNIMHGIYLDGQSLTVTTNAPGSPTPSGELNMQGYSVDWSSGTPNLLYLTNDGSIFFTPFGPNSFGYFGSSSAPYVALVNAGTISDEGSSVWADDFENGGLFYNGVGNFSLQSETADLSRGSLVAGGDVTISAGSITASNTFLEADASLTIYPTNSLTDQGGTNGTWIIGLNSIGNGFNLPILPPSGDLLDTTITLYAPDNKDVTSVWAGQDRGVSNSGYSNDEAIGHLILDALGTPPGTLFTFNGASANNALYAGRLDLLDNAGDLANGYVTALDIASNMVIYYAQAFINGVDVSSKLDGYNGGHLRWVSSYTPLALFRSLTVNPVAKVNVTPIGAPLNGVALSWNTVPYATNSVYCSTNLVSWQLFTNFVSTTPNAPANLMLARPAGVANWFYRVVVTPP